MLADANPPVALNAVAADATTGSASTIDIAASVTLNIAGQPFTLTGKFDDSAVVVEYHADFDKAINLGSIGTIATEIGNALKFPELGQLVTTTTTTLSSNAVTKPLADAINGATIRITDIVINTKTSTYGVGVAFNFAAPLDPPPPPATTPQLPTLFGITLVSIGFSVTLTKKQQDPANG